MKSKRGREWDETWNRPPANDADDNDGFGPCSPYDDDSFKPGPETQDAYEAYDVDEDKPPNNGRFKKGFSGNPAGRPRVTKGSVATRMRELRKRYVITENGKKRSVTAVEAIIKRQVMDALGGDRYARAEVLAFADRHMPRDKRESRLMARDPGERWIRWSPRLTAALEKLEEEFQAEKTAWAIDPVPKPNDDDGTKS